MDKMLGLPSFTDTLIRRATFFKTLEQEPMPNTEVNRGKF